MSEVVHGCVRGCRAAYEFATLCSRTGELVPTSGLVLLCPPQHGCANAILHRGHPGDEWHALNGDTVANRRAIYAATEFHPDEETHDE